MEAVQRNRVKVYQLNDQGGWDDKGTGYVHGELIDDRPGFRVYSEQDQTVLLNLATSSAEQYHRQGDTIISWTDPSTNIDLALSFAEATSAQELWERLCDHTGQQPAERDEDAYQPRGTLPAPELANLGEIAQFFCEVSAMARERVAQHVLQNDGEYVRKLLVLFGTCEDMEDTDSLDNLFKIFRGIVMLNDTALYDLLLTDELMDNFLGAMEYDPEGGVTRIKHREWMRSTANFKQVVTISDSVIQAKIHQNFRMQYLKDVVLPRALDDAAFTTLNSVMYFNNVEVVNHLHKDEPFMSALFAKIAAPDSPAQCRDLHKFLQELCNRAKEVQLVHRTAFYKSLLKHGLFAHFHTVLESHDKAVRLSATDILSCSLQHDASLLRQHILAQSSPQHNYELLSCIVDRLLHENDSGMKSQLKEILQMLLDPETADISRDKHEVYDVDKQKNDFFQLFYDKFFDRLIQPFCTPSADAVAATANGISAASHADPTGDEDARIFICDLLCFCVQHHSYRIKYYVLRNDIVGKVLTLLKQSQKYLILGAIRFLRSCVGLKDEFYNRYIIKNNLFEPVMKVFAANGERYNMTNSAIIELFDFIHKETVRSLLEYVVDKFREQIESVNYVETFKAVVLKYEQHKEYELHRENMTQNSRGTVRCREEELRPTTRRVIEDDDEAYFNSSDGEEEIGPRPPRQSASGDSRAPLVDYDNDDNENSSEAKRDRAGLESNTDSPATAEDEGRAKKARNE